MVKVNIYRETALPGILQANSVYLIAPAGSPNYVEMYATGTSASTVKRIINEDDIQAKCWLVSPIRQNAWGWNG